jgi:hypothetical protein
MATRRTKKRAKKRMKSPAEIIRRNAGYVLDVAHDLHETGRRVNSIIVYHEIKGVLGLPLSYDFDAGDAIKKILQEAGWEFYRRPRRS